MGFCLPCRAANARGVLFHSILENILLRLTPVELIGVFRDEVDEVSRIREAFKEFSDCLPHGFSPSVLLESNPALRNLDDELKRKLREKLNILYIEGFLPTLDHEYLLNLMTLVQIALGHLQELAVDGSINRIAGVHSEMLKTATILHRRLSRLPRGVWLP